MFTLLNDSSINEGFLGLTTFFVLISIWYYGFARPKEKRGENKMFILREKYKKERILEDRKYLAFEEFQVEVGNNNESQANDEIVRIVNLLAHQTSVSCVNQDKSNRSNKEYGRNRYDDDVHNLKRDWSLKRNCALKISPELADRMPHFSEFEPLKSYREEYILQKKSKE